MKMLMIVMMIKAVLAFIETMNKNRKNIRNDADNAKVQHPAANLLR